MLGKVIYLSGPMTGYLNYNYDAFHEAAAILRRQGFIVLNPAEHHSGRQDLTRAEYMRGDFFDILGADGIAVLPGWEHSRGALMEILMGASLDLPIFEAYDPDRFVAAEVVMQNGSLSPTLNAPTCVVESAEAENEDPFALPDESGNEEDAACPDGEDESILDIAGRLVYGDRQQSYNHPLPDMTRTGKIWAAVLGVPEITAEQVALCMIGLKMSRLCESYKKDSLIDVAGYALCIQRMKNRRAGLE